MDAAKRFGLIAIAALATSVAQARVWDEHAKQLLLRSLQHAYNVNVRAIVVQFCSESGTFQQIKVEQSKNGKSRYTIIAPLRDQGVESVDDGMKAVTYLPDNKLVLVQASTRNGYQDAKDRLALAEQNYKLSWENSPKIAGRKTVCVVATPKKGPLEERRFYIDSETAYLLRSETVGKDGNHSVKYDTRCVSYPDDMVEPGIQINELGANTVRYERQMNISRAHSGVSQVGFEPLVPSQLPYGFTVNACQVTKSDHWQAVVVRVSDGLVRGAVYQWKPDSDDGDQGSAPDRSSLMAHGIRLLMVADIPKNARERILQAFAASGDHAMLTGVKSDDMELNRCGPLFNNGVGLRSYSYVAPTSTY